MSNRFADQAPVPKKAWQARRGLFGLRGKPRSCLMFVLFWHLPKPMSGYGLFRFSIASARLWCHPCERCLSRTN